MMHGHMPESLNFSSWNGLDKAVLEAAGGSKTMMADLHEGTCGILVS